MSRRLDTLARWIRHHRTLLWCARRAVRLIPDVPWTRRFPEIGPIRFRMRQHRWLLWEPFGRSDTFMLGVFDRLVRPGDVVYDIGANIGIYCRVLCQWFGAARVIAFEPMGQNVQLLRANVALGDLADRIDVFALALGNTDGQEDLQIDDVRSSTAALSSVTGGAASAGRSHLHLPPLTERVTVARLDTLLEDHPLPPPQVMKIDTEGAEAMVLEGARDTLATHRPRLAVATHGPERASGAIALLKDLGYTSYGFVKDDGGQRYAPLDPADGARLANNNFVSSMIAEDVREPLVARSPAECATRAASTRRGRASDQEADRTE